MRGAPEKRPHRVFMSIMDGPNQSSDDRSCPRCEYKWAGLPERGRCPECGLGYDEDTRVWHCRQEWRSLFWWILVIGGAAVAYAAVSLLQSTGILAGEPTFRMVLLLGIVAAYGGCLVLLYREMSRRRYVATSAEGIVFQYGVKTLSIPWEHVAAARQRMDYAAVYAIDGTVRSISGFQTVEDLEEFLQVVEERLATRRERDMPRDEA